MKLRTSLIPLSRIFVILTLTGPGVGSSARLKPELLRWDRWFHLLGMMADLAIQIVSLPCSFRRLETPLLVL